VDKEAEQGDDIGDIAAEGCRGEEEDRGAADRGAECLSALGVWVAEVMCLIDEDSGGGDRRGCGAAHGGVAPEGDGDGDIWERCD
jgi:hypothetical protein